MKTRILILFFCLTALLSQGQDKTQAYIDTYKNIAIAEMRRTGVPAAITLAQGIEESGCGDGDLCKISNNHFGIKCKNEWTGAKVYHDDDLKSECFRSYTTPEESFKDHSDFLKTREPYAFLFDLDPKDYKGWAYGLKKAGYATEKDYPARLIKLIDDYNLNQYSLVALNEKSNTEDAGSFAKQTVDTPAKDSSTKQETASENAIVKDTVLGELIIPVNSHKQTFTTIIPAETKEDSVSIITPSSNNSVKEMVKSSYPDGVFSINHTKVIYVPEGTSLLAIASKNGIALSSLLSFNDMDEVDVTTSPQLIFLEKKQTRGGGDIHIVKAHESLFEISQEEGVRLEKILEYNKLKKESIVKQGEKILLHPTATFGLSR